MTKKEIKRFLDSVGQHTAEQISMAASEVEVAGDLELAQKMENLSQSMYDLADAVLGEPRSESVYILMADGDATLRSVPEPFGVAVTTEEEAQAWVKDSGWYRATYQRIETFPTWREAVEGWRQREAAIKAQREAELKQRLQGGTK